MNPDPTLHNADLAPVHPEGRTWGWFEIFNVWVNDIQSLFGYTLAATLFLAYGLPGWAVLLAILLAGFVVMVLVNLSGEPGVRYGIPYPVLARASMGVRGANFPAMVRGTVAIFWYGVQTYFASTALALLLNTLLGHPGGPELLGMNGVGWASYVLVCVFQVWIFLHGVDRVSLFLNWAGPLVFGVMVLLLAVIWLRAGTGLWSQAWRLFEGGGQYPGGPWRAFVAVTGTMIAYFAAVVINYGDFSRFVRTEGDMRRGNLLGLPVGLTVFSLLTLFLTAGTGILFGEPLTNPADVVGRVDNPLLTVLAAATFLVATVGINLVANFIPPAYDLSNLAPRWIDARTGGLLAAGVAFFIGALWVSVIEAVGIATFVDTLGAVLAPLYGIMVADYWIIRRRELVVDELFSAEPDGRYHYRSGWNPRAMAAFLVAASFSVATVWVPALAALSGYGWLIGACAGGALYVGLTRG